MTRPLRLGTRSSPLARWQAEWVSGQLTALGHGVELVPITTQGDVQLAPLGQIGGQGLFTKELQRALLDDRIDLAVHSLKDMPTFPVEGLAIAAVPSRESIADVLMSREGLAFDQLPQNCRVGTGSIRRRSQLLNLRPDLQMLEIRGNVETRLKKLDDGEYDAIILAEAGLKRLGLADRITAVLPLSVMLPAVGQGALGIEARSNDAEVRQILQPLDHAPTHASVLAERSLLATLRAGCLAPVAAWGRFETDGLLHLDAVVARADGTERIEARGESRSEEATALGRLVAEKLQALGADQIIAGERNG